MTVEAVDASAAAPANDTALPATTTADTAAPADTTARPDPAATKPTIDDDLKGVWERLHPKRGDGGRFAPRDAGKPAAAVATATDPNATATDATAAEGADPDAKDTDTNSTDQPAGGKPETAQTAPSIEAPHSWSAETKAKWASVPPELQGYIAKREADAHQAITRAGEQIKAFEPFRNVLDHFGETFKRANLHPVDAVGRLLDVESKLQADAPNTIKAIAKAYGVDLQRLISEQPAAATTADPGTGAPDPRVSTLESKLTATEAKLEKVMSHLTAQQRALVESEHTALARQIADFAKDKPHFEAVRKHMGALMQADESLTLESAYEQATYAVPDIRNRILTDQRKAEEAKQAKVRAAQVADAKKAGSVNVKSSTSSGGTPKTMDDTLREVAARRYA